VHQLLNRGGVKQAPDPERSDDQSDRAEGEPEAQMQIGADIGEGAPSDARLDEHGEDDEARPRVGEHGDIVGDETARGLLAVAGRARARVGQQLEHEPCGRQREQSREHEKDAAPAEQLAEHTARRLAEQLAENLPREIAREHRLAALVGRHVADIGHGERNDPTGGRARPAPPAAKRAAASAESDCTVPQSATRIAASAHITVTVRYLPKRSPTGPMMSWIEPWLTA